MSGTKVEKLVSLVAVDLTEPEVGTLDVDAGSGLLYIKTPGAIRFGFSYAGHAFEADAVAGEGKMLVEAVTTIGRLPFSIEDRTRRGYLMRAIAALGDSGLQPLMSREQVIRLRIEAAIEPPATSNRIIGAIVERLMPARGYLDLFTDLIRRPKTSVPAVIG